MYPQEFGSNFVLSPEEKERFILRCADISVEVLGEPRDDCERDMRERRLKNGDYAKLSRTAISSMG